MPGNGPTMHETDLAPAQRTRQAHDRMLLQFGVAAWVTLLALGLVLLL